MQPGRAARQWAAELAAWAIDPGILAAAPESPYAFTPALFAPDRSAGSPLLTLAAQALPAGGSVLDVGAGTGAASIPLRPGHLHAVDSQPSMLAALERHAAEAGVPVTTYEGSWPAVADDVPVCDVAVCSHVFYNVPDLEPFVRALARATRRRVVVELHQEHPWVPIGPLWAAVHHQPRPSGPTADLALAVLAGLGIRPQVTGWELAPVDLTGERFDTYVEHTRRRLCLGPDRDEQVAALVRRHPPGPRRSVVLSWEP